MRRNIIVLVLLMFFINSCRIFKPEAYYSYHAVWNNNSKTFEKTLVQLGYVTPDFFVESYKKSGDTVFVKVDLELFELQKPGATAKFLIECDKDGNIIDTVLHFSEEKYAFFKYKKNKNSFFVLKEENKERGAYLTDRIFRMQAKAHSY